MKVILVTGATGFIGTHLVWALCERELQKRLEERRIVRIIARPNGRTNQFALLKMAGTLLELRVGQICEPNDVRDVCGSDVEYIYHLAAMGGDWGDYDAYFEANVVATQNLVDAASKLPNLKRFLHTSTVDVYGDTPTRLCVEDVPLNEAGRIAGYSKTKILAEKVVMRAQREAGLRATIVRPSVVYGPGSRSWGTTDARIIAERHGVLIDRGDRASGVIHVRDVIDGMIMAAESDNTVGRIYNLSDDQVTWRAYFDALADGIGEPRTTRSIPLWLAWIIAVLMEWVWTLLRWGDRPLLTRFVLGLIGREQRYPIDAAWRDFGWKPRVPFREGMAEHTQWLVETGSHLR
jgi:nucleoside-diphosphate-sugar epimerase